MFGTQNRRCGTKKPKDHHRSDHGSKKECSDAIIFFFMTAQEKEKGRGKKEKGGGSGARQEGQGAKGVVRKALTSLCYGEKEKAWWVGHRQSELLGHCHYFQACYGE